MLEFHPEITGHFTLEKLLNLLVHQFLNLQNRDVISDNYFCRFL